MLRDQIQPSIFKRKNFLLRVPEAPEQAADTAEPAVQPAAALKETKTPVNDKDFRVLVINSSHEMAKEITMQLNLNLPGCSITYAPSIELAAWILSRRQVDLVISSPILPDGSISRLHDVLKKCKTPPDVMVVGSARTNSPEVLGISGYRFAACRQIGGQAGFPRIVRSRNEAARPEQSNDLSRSIKNLGADLRNDLNNPLQEIVAMVFVAKAGNATSESTAQALAAIDSAARNMAKVVKGIEDKIREAVRG